MYNVSPLEVQLTKERLSGNRLSNQTATKAQTIHPIQNSLRSNIWFTLWSLPLR